jgi:A/G-specific adenine glycosylase
VHAPPKAKATLDVLWDAAAAMVRIDSGKGSFRHAYQIKNTDSLNQENSMSSHPENTAVQGTSMEDALYPGDINQALIELGSTVCKVREPDCETCPLRAWCLAYAVSKSDMQKVIIAGC